MQKTIEIALDTLPAERGLRTLSRSLAEIGESADRQQPSLQRLSSQIGGISGQLAELERRSRPMTDALRTAAEGIQRGFSDAFTVIFREGRLRFGDLADHLKSAFARLLGELAALAIARPVVVPVVTGLGSLLGLSGSAVAGVTDRLGGPLGGSGPGITDLLGLGRSLMGGDILSPLLASGLPSLFGATAVGLGGGATAASLGVSAVAGGMSNAGIATAGSLAGFGSALSLALPVAGIALPFLLGGLFGGKPSDHTASLQGMLSGTLRPTEDGANAETRQARDALQTLVMGALSEVTRGLKLPLPDDLYLDLATGGRDGNRFWLYRTQEDLYGQPASARPDPLASGSFADAEGLVAALVESLSEAMTGSAVTLEQLTARNFADAARRAADGIPDALDQVIARFRELRGSAEDLAARGLIDLDAVLADLRHIRDDGLTQALSGLDAPALRAVIDYYSTVESNIPVLRAAESALAALGQTAEGTALRLTAAQRAYADAQIAAAEEYLRALEDQAADWRRMADTLARTRLSLLVDPELSPLSPADRLTEARRQFDEVSARAQLGDSAAIGELPDLSRRLLEASRAYHASSADYFADFERVSSVLQATESLATRQLAIAESQLSSLRSQTDTLRQMLTGQQAIATSLAQLPAILQGLIAGLGASGGGGSGSGGGGSGGVSYVPGSYGETASSSEYMAEIGLTRSTRDAILAGLGQTMSGGGTVRDRIDSDAAFADSYRAAIIAAGGTPNFAAGGWHAGGLRLVGEQGPELEATGPARLFTAGETRRLLAPADGADETAGEIAALRRQQAREAEQARADLASLRAEMAAIRQSLGRIIAAG
ncbi:hypothetical protein [Oceanibaculum indicum]|uniref:Bacteriophage tail tape measure N-terminal domain-containing protein n=1 Tax=Oceanibaculum indicum P24 TaxID=1207063 RepID=K2K4A7_9PROT|nr:hypothetical protein [Oceanibaculum indicum]EKE72260.1 hypothetical protein P24_13840 [Oceanibaculum indicum P24]